MSGGVTADNKVYDGTTAATLNFDSVVIDGMITGDDLGVDAMGTFADKNVGIDKVVTIGDLVLTGDDADNYIVAQSGNQTETTASITVREITCTVGEPDGNDSQHHCQGNHSDIRHYGG